MPSLTDILKKLTTKPNKPRTSADLKADFEAIDLKALEAQVDGLEAERRRLLLAGSDDDVVAISTELSAANMSLERALVARDELGKRIAEAVEREAAAATVALEAEAVRIREEIEADRAEVEKAADQVSAMLADVGRKIGTLTCHEQEIAAKRGRQRARVPDLRVIRDGIVERVRLPPETKARLPRYANAGPR